MMRLGLVLAVIVMVLVGAGRWLGDHRASREAAKPRLTTPDNSDYYLADATLYTLNKDGSLAYRAHAAQALHFPDESARLHDIDVHYVTTSNGYWDVHANEGRIPAGKHDIYLYDGVRGQNPRDANRAVHFTTTHAWVHPDDHLITSGAPVKATEPGQVVTGTGMRVNLTTNKLNLLDNVHVTYDP